MSASEKLRALNAFQDPEHRADPILNALPQIIALVEAAEGLYDRCEELRLDYTDPAGVGDGMKETQAALAALDEVLP